MGIRPILPSLDDAVEEIQYRLCEGATGLREFSQQAWKIIEPSTPLVWEWYHDAICDLLQTAVETGCWREVLINIPPRMGKSTLVSVMFPSWVWGPGKRPSTKWIFSSYAQSLSERDSQRRRIIMGSPWYRRGWGHLVAIGTQRFLPDGQLKYMNTRMGYHLATSVEGSNTGEGGDYIVYDDPHNLNDIHSDVMRENVLRWDKEVMSSRLNDQAKGIKFLIAQRGHELDLSGAWLAEHRSDLAFLSLPNEFEPRRRSRIFLNGRPFLEDPRTTAGELLSPVRLGTDATDALRKRLGSWTYATQYQQSPAPEEGGILKRAWWRYWAPRESGLVGTLDENGRTILPLPKKFHQTLQSWDASFKKTLDGSYVVGQQWQRHQALSYLIDQHRERESFTNTLRAMLAFSQAHPADRIVVEEKANGSAILDTLAMHLPGIIGADVDISKEARCHAAAPRVEAGNYVLPHPSLPGFQWVEAFLHECTLFPNAAHDDQVDALTMADRWLYLHDDFTEENFGQPNADLGF